MLEANIDKFRTNVSRAENADYGDFMRAVNEYLETLREHIAFVKDPSIYEKLEEIKEYVQYTPNWDVRSTRIRLVKDIQYIEQLLKGHDQDWESATIPGARI